MLLGREQRELWRRPLAGAKAGAVKDLSRCLQDPNNDLRITIFSRFGARTPGMIKCGLAWLRQCSANTDARIASIRARVADSFLLLRAGWDLAGARSQMGFDASILSSLTGLVILCFVTPTVGNGGLFSFGLAA